MSSGNYWHEVTSNGNSYVTRCKRCGEAHYYSAGPGYLTRRFEWIQEHEKQHSDD